MERWRANRVGAVSVLLSACLGACLLGAPGAAGLPLVSHHGRWLTDPAGRVVILHGVQIDKFEPSAPVEYIDLAPVNVRFIAAEGFNLARVSLAYAGVEPQLGRFDSSYVDSYLAFDRRLARAGIYDLVDMMQGEYSQAVGGWGFPNWMTITNGSLNTQAPFPSGYETNPAENAAWDSFWSNDPVSGVGLIDRYAQGLNRLAGAFARAPGLLGLEILNEPWPGSAWPSCFSASGCPAGSFDQTSFTHFYRTVIPEVRAADRRHLILYEPNLLFDFGRPTQLGELADPNLVFAFHDYCLAYALGQPDPTDQCPGQERMVLANAESRAAATGDGLLMDEWGNTTDPTRIERMTAEADQDMVGWSVWAYEDCCKSPAAIVADGTKPPTAAGNLNLPELTDLVRPYPKLIAGTPSSWGYDPASDQFTLAFSTRPVAGAKLEPGADSEIELPALRYPTGYTARVEGAEVLSAPDANLLRLASEPGARVVTLTVAPANHHPRAPGPFSWPSGATEIAAADCPPQAHQVIRITGDDEGRARLDSVSIYVDGTRTGEVRGPVIRRVELPAGMADGTEIQLLATTSYGTRLATTRFLSGCSLPQPTWSISSGRR